MRHSAQPTRARRGGRGKTPGPHTRRGAVPVSPEKAQERRRPRSGRARRRPRSGRAPRLLQARQSAISPPGGSRAAAGPHFPDRNQGSRRQSGLRGSRSKEQGFIQQRALLDTHCWVILAPLPPHRRGYSCRPWARPQHPPHAALAGPCSLLHTRRAHTGRTARGEDSGHSHRDTADRTVRGGDSGHSHRDLADQ